MSALDEMVTAYEWYLNGALVSTDANYAFTSDVPGDYAVSCVRTTPLCSATSESTITNAALPGTMLTVNANGDFQASDGAQWIWYVDGVEVPGQTGQILPFSALGNNLLAEIWVVTISESGCVAQSESIVLIGVQEEEAEIRTYPNPADGYVEIRSMQSMGSVSMYSIEGTLVLHEKCNGMQHRITTTGLVQGTYVLECKDAEGNICGYSRMVVCH